MRRCHGAWVFQRDSVAKGRRLKKLECVSVNRTDLAALREKYEEMLRLRLADALARGASISSSEREPSNESKERRNLRDADLATQRAMATLAARFPGALREIDELPLGVLEDRVLAPAKQKRAQRCKGGWNQRISFTRSRAGLYA